MRSVPGRATRRKRPRSKHTGGESRVSANQLTLRCGNSGGLKGLNTRGRSVSLHFGLGPEGCPDLHETEGATSYAPHRRVT
eukprot:8842213-Heterocapsa_arctica.AAC.1